MHRLGVVVLASRQKRSSRDAQQKEGGDAPPPPPPLPTGAMPGAVPVPDNDPWEGERFDAVGAIASALIPVLAILAICTGLYASSTYDQGATVFLDAPKGPEDTAKLVPTQQLPAAQLQRG